MNKNKIYIVFKKGIIILCLLVILSSSFVNLYKDRSKILFKIKDLLLSQSKGSTPYFYSTDKDIYWANEILNGNYILHFRHAEREKWIDLHMYDVMESDYHNNGIDESAFAENKYYANAVCLNERGKIQAKAMKEVLSRIKLPVSRVLSSVSCRSRQTANLAFGGYDSLHRILVHPGPYLEKVEDRMKNVELFYSSLTPEANTNIVVSSHNGVIRKEIFKNQKRLTEKKLVLEEGGFYIISNKPEGNLILEHEFHSFSDFVRTINKR